MLEFILWFVIASVFFGMSVSGAIFGLIKIGFWFAVIFGLIRTLEFLIDKVEERQTKNKKM
jgi:hypothetical protein